ncbi:hypothetical protein [Capnocytophaga canimorsus]|uniref:hypothetical protein n=1 Tax=Capnocytophaga canimorsus TaxID=28188 RepID=UPI003859199C
MDHLKFLSVKDIMKLLNCSKHEASKLRNEIADEYRITPKRVTSVHLKKYLKL